MHWCFIFSCFDWIWTDRLYWVVDWKSHDSWLQEYLLPSCFDWIWIFRLYFLEAWYSQLLHVYLSPFTVFLNCSGSWNSKFSLLFCSCSLTLIDEISLLVRSCLVPSILSSLGPQTLYGPYSQKFKYWSFYMSNMIETLKKGKGTRVDAIIKIHPPPPTTTDNFPKYIYCCQ